ncbi:MAG TPA: hypothetical protein EYN89_02605 [Flavobacteriales bacterium]|nr:hypothetical protein [Flavobacteriales bacterium]
MKTVKRISLIFILTITFAIAAGLVIAYLYQDQVKNYLVEELNNHLKAEIGVSDITFSVLKKFPLASLEFSNVWCKAVGENHSIDTLFKAEKTYLQFHIMDIFNNKYSIVRLDLEKGLINIKYDKSGNGNYYIWKEQEKESTQNEKSFSIDLEKIVLTDINLNYHDPRAKQMLDFQIGKLIADGKFLNKHTDINLSYDLLVKQINIENSAYLKNQNIIGDLELSMDSSYYEITRGSIKTGNIDFDVSGSFNKNKADEDKYDLDIILYGERLMIPSLLSLLPNQNSLEPYTISGKSDLEVEIAGLIGKGSTPSVQLNYQTSGVKIIVDSINFELSEINMAGYYKYQSGQGKNAHEFNSKTFRARIGSDILNGTFRIWNFTDPMIDLELSGSLNLKNLKSAHFPGLDSLLKLSGEIEIEGRVKGPIKAFVDKNAYLLKTLEISGILTLQKVAVQINEGSLPIKINNGELILNNNDVFAENLVVEVESSRLVIDGYFKNVVPFCMSRKQHLLVSAKINSEKIDLNEFLQDHSSSNKTDTIYELRLPGNIDFNLNLDISSLVFRKFVAKEIKGLLKLKNEKLIAQNFSFRSMDGFVKAKGVIDATNKILLVSCDAEVEEVNITKMFYQFENFGQHYLTDQNIKGKTNASIQFASMWNRDLTPIEERIYTNADITIKKGELINFEPLMELSDHIELAELKKVRFSNLSNQITIKNRNIHIPKMEVLSSALNITTTGIHSFDQDINYKFKIYLPELLGKKSRKAKKENTEFGVIEDDGLGMWLFLTMTGTVDNPIIKYDKKGYLQKIGADFKEEKQTLKQILNEEFGWFKKDTTITEKKKEKNKKKKEKFGDDYFIIEWDEDAQIQEDDDDDDF